MRFRERFAGERFNRARIRFALDLEPTSSPSGPNTPILPVSLTSSSSRSSLAGLTASAVVPDPIDSSPGLSTTSSLPVAESYFLTLPSAKLFTNRSPVESSAKPGSRRHRNVRWESSLRMLR